ncbi:MAG: rRNA maturation RNase YbeY [Bacteroidota bacterium]
MVEVRTLHRAMRVPHVDVARLVHAVARGEGVALVAVAVVLLGDRRMRQLNTQHLRHPWTTDVLSFLYEQRSGIDGEIVVNLDQARRQAPRFGATFREEVRRLVIHGMLHLTGYDDRTATERVRMRRMEERYLSTSH